jgi:hypothetical protein
MDTGASECAICGAPALPVCERSRAWAILLGLLLVTAAAVGTTVLLAAHHRQPASPPAGPFPVYTTLPAPSSLAVAAPSSTSAPTTSSSAAVGPACPPDTAQYLPGGSGTALLAAQTPKYFVTVCQTGDGQLYYLGRARSAPGGHLFLPAQRSGSGFLAVNGDYRYVIAGGRLVVSEGSAVLSDDPLTPTG